MTQKAPNYNTMIASMNHLYLVKSVKDLLGAGGANVGTWGQLGKFLEVEHGNPSVNFGQVYEKLQELYTRNEARKGNPNLTEARGLRLTFGHCQDGAYRAMGTKDRGLLPTPDHGGLAPPPSLPEGKTLVVGSLASLEPELQPSAYLIEGLDEAPTLFPTTKGTEEDLLSSPIDKHSHPIARKPELQTVKWHEDDLIAFSDKEDA